MRFDDLVRALLLPDDLGNAIIIALKWRCGDYDRRLQTFEFASAAGQFTIVRSAGEKVALFKV